MRDAHVDSGTGRDVEGLADLVLLVHCEQSSVMALLNGDEGDARLVAALEHHARLAHRTQLVLQHLKRAN